MFEPIATAFNLLQLEAATYPQGVQVWMKLMAASLLAGLLFAYWRKGARWILAALLINIVGLIIIKMIMPDLTRSEIGTFIHLIFWPPILWQVWNPANRQTFRRPTSAIAGIAYFAWLGWASLVMMISLVLDFRNIITILF